MDSIRKNEIFAVLLFALGVFIFLSIFTFNEHDIAFYTSDPNTVTQNRIGEVGAYLGFILLFTVGKASYVLPFLILVWSVSRLLQITQKKLFFKLFGTIFLVTAVSSSLAMFNYSSKTLAFSSGGLIGSVVIGFLLNYLGAIGAIVCISATIVLSVLIATEFLIFPVVVKLIEYVRTIAGTVTSRFKKTVLDGKRKESAVSVDVTPVNVTRVSREKERPVHDDIRLKLEKMRQQVEAARNTQLKSSGKPALTKDRNNVFKPVKEPKLSTPKEKIRAKDPVERVTPIIDASTGTSTEYVLPDIGILKAGNKSGGNENDEDIKVKAALIEKTLLDFDVAATVVKINRGPVVTMYELEPSIGTKVSKITSLGDNISLAMKSSNIRIVAPLPGKGTIGIEVPNDKSEMVRLKDIVELDEFSREESKIKLALGKDISGTPIILDLAAMPHLLIAGSTNSGKTVCLNAIISSLLLNYSPDELKFLMVDPKRVELQIFEGIPHLVCPIVTNAKKVDAALGWILKEMERRYDLFASKSVKNIALYRERKQSDWENIPYIVVIIDEFAELMAVAQQEIEDSVMRLAQLARAAGIHLILATQRPSVDVITGVIKANMPARISFRVANKTDSRIVIDTNGADKLLGRGDMLIMEPGNPDIVRGQCCYVDDLEIRGIVDSIKTQTGTRYIESAVASQDKKKNETEHKKDDIYFEAVKMVLQTKQASVSMLQRRFSLGYSRAARVLDIMEQEGIVGPYNGSKPREILVENIEELERKAV
ncbi:MAG: DNA translocase FtsK [Candidatus Omnitrophica bacterium]|nr:DNA translocase FtsK [Candidatus Omnitrophota bacterium]